MTKVSRYLQVTIDDYRIIKINSMDILKTYFDAVYEVHPDMSSHTSGTMSIGIGVLHTRLSKQKFNTKSSIEAELVSNSKDLLYHI